MILAALAAIVFTPIQVDAVAIVDAPYGSKEWETITIQYCREAGIPTPTRRQLRECVAITKMEKKKR